MYLSTYIYIMSKVNILLYKNVHVSLLDCYNVVKQRLSTCQCQYVSTGLISRAGPSTFKKLTSCIASKGSSLACMRLICPRNRPLPFTPSLLLIYFPSRSHIQELQRFSLTDLLSEFENL